MSLSELSIRRPVFAWMLMSALIIFGGVSFLRLGVSQLPDVDFPILTVNLSLPGAAPEVMETDVVDVVENSLMTIHGVTKVSSTSRNGTATVTVELAIDRNIDLALQDVQAKVAEAQKKLPKEIEPPTITKTNPDDQPILWLATSSDTMPMKDLMTYVRDYLSPNFSTTPDVGDINLGGYVDPNLRVWVSEQKLASYQLTVNDVIAAIGSEHSEPPAGWIADARHEYNVRTLGEASSTEEFGKLIINSRGGQPNYRPIYLGQVAKIEDDLADIRRISRAQGAPAVGLGIRKQRGSNAVAVADQVKKRLKELELHLPKGVKLGINFDSTTFIKDAVHELNFTLVLSALLTSLVCWFFLGSWSSTVNVLMSIPTSIVGTFLILYFAGFTLNTFTLLGLSLAIGIVVDDAIMVLENIIRHREMGKDRVTASIDGAKEITFAALAATISIVAIFLPVAFMQGVIGRFFFQFGVTMTAAVLLSLVEALTLTPMRCSQFLDSGERTSRLGRSLEHAIAASAKIYHNLLQRCLAYPKTTIAASLVIFGLSVLSVRALNKEMLPAEDQSRFMVRIKTPVGSSLAYTDAKFKEAEKFFATRPEIKKFFISVGGFGGGEINTGIAFISMKNKGERGRDPQTGRELSQADLMDLCRVTLNKIPDVTARVQDLSMRGFAAGRGYAVEFSILGPEWEKLGEYSQTITKKLEATGLVTDIDTDYNVGMPEIQVIPNRAKAIQRGVSIAAIGQTVNALIGGVVVGKFAKSGHRYDIRLKLLDEVSDRARRISSLNIRNNRGELVPLGDVTTIREKPSLLSVSRQNRQRAVTLGANIARGKSQQTALDATVKIGKEVLPEGYRLVLTGSSQSFKDSMMSLFYALIMGLIVAYMILASQFNSFVHPFTVLMALPFSLSGAFLALLVTGQSLNLYSMIGLILLMGIVKKNSILLVDFTNQVRNEENNLSVKSALLKACPVRLRPILMTSLATIVGALPAALAIGPGAESRIPMAIAVIGGVLFSTVLTLIVVPCVYQTLAKLERKHPARLQLEVAA